MKVKLVSHTASFRKTIQRRIENRTCTRQEWHAYRRWLSWSRRYGVELPDYYFAAPVINAEFLRAGRKMMRALKLHTEAIERAFAMSRSSRRVLSSCHNRPGGSHAPPLEAWRRPE
jgi:hypothetical protein